MLYIIIGCVGFLCFYLFDWNKIRFIHAGLNAFFPVGILMLLYATIGILGTSQAHFYLAWPLRLIFGLLAAISLGMQFYVLFFALPLKETYWSKGEKQIVIRKGLYGMCRHPGVLFFFFFFCFLWLATGINQVLYAGLIWTAMDVLHVYVQDRWMFPKNLIYYKSYQKTTPFLIPDRQSIKALNIKEKGKML